jgi:hypothetical protein
MPQVRVFQRLWEKAREMDSELSESRRWKIMTTINLKHPDRPPWCNSKWVLVVIGGIMTGLVLAVAAMVILEIFT